MVAFLECLRQVIAFAEDRADEQNVDLRIPHQLSRTDRPSKEVCCPNLNRLPERGQCPFTLVLSSPLMARSDLLSSPPCPHRIHKDKIGDVSIRLGSSDETWTRALRHVLLDLKILLADAVR